MNGLTSTKQKMKYPETGETIRSYENSGKLIIIFGCKLLGENFKQANSRLMSPSSCH